MITATIDTRGLERMLYSLEKKDIPKAARNTLRDVMKDTIKREQREMRRVFDRPTPLVLNGVRITKLPQTNDLTGALGFKDVYGKKGSAVLDAVTPHIPGRRAVRSRKGMERALQSMGLIKSNEYLVPSRTMRLNRYGNVPGATASKMLNDVGALAAVSGRGSTTGTRKRRYMWATLKTKSGKAVKGIWLESKLRSGAPGALQMVVVQGSPTYGKRFRFEQVAISWGSRVALKHARKTVDHYIRRKYGG